MIDLKPFCACTNDPRTYLATPQQHNGWLIACNGHIAVRVADITATAPSTHEHCSAVEMMFLNAHKTMQPLPAFEPGEICASCDGKGQYKQAKCISCDGKGEFEHHNYDYDCYPCDGNGWLNAKYGEYISDVQIRACERCGGHGIHSRAVKVYGTWFDAIYLSRIKALPGLQIAVAPPVDAQEGASLPPMFFTFDGGQGLLMPRRE